MFYLDFYFLIVCYVQRSHIPLFGVGVGVNSQAEISAIIKSELADFFNL